MKRKLILDTNLWSYIGDEGASETLGAAIDKHDCIVLIPPSMLMEILRNPHRESRLRHLDAISGTRGRRMASEAQLCAEEFVRLVKRRRPYWLRSIADMATVAKYNRRWTKEWWRWAAEDPDLAHDVVIGGDDVTGEATDTQRDNRRRLLDSKFGSDYNNLRFSADARSAAAYLPGWDGHEVDAWRVDVGLRYWHTMATGPTSAAYDGMVKTMRQWIGSYIEMPTAIGDPNDFASLWIDEAAPCDVPRDWVRTAMAYTQTTMKVGPGNPRDEQHSAYLTDADIFLSADRRLITALTEVRRQAPFRVAAPRLVDTDKGTLPVVGAIDRALA